MNIRENKGVAGADVAVAIAILVLFVSFITGLFYNIGNTSKKIERKSVATDLAIQVIETLKQIPMEDLPVIQDRVEIANSNINEIKSIEVKNGYKCYVKIIDYNDAGIAKILTVDVEYQMGKQNQTETVNIETLVKSDSTNIIIVSTLSGSASVKIATEVDLSLKIETESNISTIKWYYKKDGESTYQMQTDTNPSLNEGVVTKKMTGLEPSTKYNIYAMVYDESGIISKSNAIDLTTGPAIAEYNSTKYTSIQYAIDDVPTTGTVKVLVSHTTTGVSIPTSKNITLNVNNKEVKTSQSIENNGTCTINGNGTLTSTTTATKSLINNHGTLNITNGTYNSSSTGIIIGSNKGTININGGTLNMKRSANPASDPYWPGISIGNTTLNITGGTINMTTTGYEHTINAWSSSKVNISGGRINRTNTSGYTTEDTKIIGSGAILIQNTATLTMSGTAYVYSDTKAYATVHIAKGGTFYANGGKIDGNLVCYGTQNGSSTEITR